MGKRANKTVLLQRIYVGYVEVEDTYHLIRSTQRSAERRYRRGVCSRFGYEIEMQQARRRYQKLYEILGTLEQHYHQVLALP